MYFESTFGSIEIEVHRSHKITTVSDLEDAEELGCHHFVEVLTGVRWLLATFDG